MLAFVYNILFLLAAGGGEGGFAGFYNKYLNYPGFELWKFLNLAIFIGILTYLLKKPLGDAFKAKREAIRAELIKAEEEKKAALSELASTEAKLAQLDAEKESVLKNAQAEAAAEKKRLAEQTEVDTQRMREQSESEITRLSHQIRSELKRFSAEESIRLAEEKLRSQIDAEQDSRLVKASIHAMGGLN